MSSIVVKGVKRALPGEKILINISIQDENVMKIGVSLSKLLSLRRTLNYDLDLKQKSKKKIEFYISEFKFKNNLALELISEKPENPNEEALVIVTAFNEKQEIIETIKYSLLILRPVVEFTVSHGKKKGLLKMKLKQLDPLITTYFAGLLLTGRDHETKARIEVEMKRFTMHEYIDHIDKIPLIFDLEHAIKEIVIYSDRPVDLQIRAIFHDVLKNQYKSNVSEIELDPARGFECIPEKKMFKTNFEVFNVVGLEAPIFAEV